MSAERLELMCACTRGGGGERSFRLLSVCLLCALSRLQWLTESLHIYSCVPFHLRDAEWRLKSVCVYSLSFLSFHFSFLLPLTSLHLSHSSVSPSHRLIPFAQNNATFLSDSTSTSLLFPAFSTPTTPQPHHPSSLLQVVKWILLSQSHQGKGRKRKRIEPKVNYKEVGDTLLY